MEHPFTRDLKQNVLLQSVTLHQLQMFEAVARHGSFTLAAKELYLTQPTVSVQLKSLAEIVGVPLLEKLGKKFYVTEAGQELLKTCQEIFAQLKDLEVNLQEKKGLEQGQLRVSAATTAKYFFPKLLKPFYHRYPGISVAFEVSTHATILERLAQNLDDFYILSRLPDHHSIEIQPFLDNPLVVVVPIGHPLIQKQIQKQHLTLHDLDGETFIMREKGSATREAVEQLFHQHGISVQVLMESSSNETIKQMICLGLGISILSSHSLTYNSLTSQLSILNVEYFPIQQQWYSIFPKNKILSTVAKTFIEFLAQESSIYCQIDSLQPFQRNELKHGGQMLGANLA